MPRPSIVTAPAGAVRLGPMLLDAAGLHEHVLGGEHARPVEDADVVKECSWRVLRQDRRGGDGDGENERRNDCYRAAQAHVRIRNECCSR